MKLIKWGLLLLIVLSFGCAMLNTHVVLFYPPLPGKSAINEDPTVTKPHIANRSFIVEVIDKREEKILAVTSVWKPGGKPVTWVEADNDPAQWVKQAICFHLKQSGCCTVDATEKPAYTLICTLNELTSYELPPSKIPAYAYFVGTTKRVKATGICVNIELKNNSKILCSSHIDGDYIIEESALKSKEHETNFFALALQNACIKTMNLIEECIAKEENKTKDNKGN